MTFNPVEAQSPIINVWYGDTQEFGNNGEPQTWCNIQGNITDDGTINSFTYTLNGGSSINLSIGPDNRRLENSGDFNIDLDVTNFLPGANTVVISAIDNELNTSNKTVTINYTENNTWPIPYSIDWSTLNNDITKINEVSHVVDGKFELTPELSPTPEGIKTAEPGYDRLIAIGDITSTNYEVLVPITIHNMPSNGGVGVLLRWQGHTDTPVSCAQPKCGYEPHGAISWFRSSKVEFYQGNSINFTPALDVTYMFRTSVETETLTGNTIYRIKFWEQGSAEPVAWNIEQTEDASNLQEGSLLLISHQADVTFGNVSVTPGSLSISNVQTQLSNNNTEATITWNTNQPTTSRIDYGPTVAYENGFVETTNLVTSHSINLTGLTADTVYQYKISGENSSLETIEKADLVLSTYTSGIQSDDFCGNTLDPVWTFDNPLNDCSYALTGSGTSDAFLEITVPGGSEHQNYTSGIKSPNLMQSINNSDFEVEVKFESGVTTPQYQQQGILVKESSTDFLRFEFYSRDNNRTYLYAQAFNNLSAQTAYVNDDIEVEGFVPLYMRVKRVGNQWTLSYSFDGTNFTQGTTFFHNLVPTQIGPYSGNAVGSSSPAHTAKIDYFLNLEDPITAEDGCFALQPPVLASIGNQSVVVDNNLPLTLTASDADGNASDIDFTETGLPSFAVLTDNNDGTASLDISPLTGDEGTYPMTIVVTDGDGLTDEETFDIVVTSTNTTVSNLVSDDFCTSTLNSIWTFIDPIGDGTLELTNSGTDDAFLEISVPAGLEHQLWKDNGIQAPHIMQASNDSDFELEVKMESPVNSPAYQQQGIIVKQDDYNFLRFEISSDNSDPKALAAILEGTNSYPLTSAIPFNIDIGNLNEAPIYMKVKREGDQWTQSYSFDNITWEVAGTFNHSMVVNGVGLFAGNAIGSSSPAHTAKFDYFLNLADPITTEDGCNAPQAPVLASIGNQSVVVDNSLLLSLTATDADGNAFDIDFTEIGLPSFAVLTDNNDGTASLAINPQTGDEGTYAVTIVVTDSDGLTDEETFDIMVTAINTSISNLVSDDFCNDELNPIWTFVDPLGGGSSALTGSGTTDAFLEITVPGGASHELWTNGIQVPHIKQAANDTDFELEVKIASAVNLPRFQEQGIMVRQDDFHFLRFEFYSNTAGTFIIAANLDSATNSLPLTASLRINTNIGAVNTAPLYMRIKREADLWTQSYSTDGQNWTLFPSFTYAMTVNEVGLYSGNASGGTAPAHTAQFDYFENLEDSILNEDSCELCTGGLIATWNGSISSDWEDPNNWTPNVAPTVCSEITIPATANTPAISNNATIKDLTIDSGSNVLVSQGTTLSITGNLTMYSAADTFSGLVVNGNIAVSGTTKYHRYTNANLNRNDLISPPLAGQSWTSFLTSDSNYNADILFNNGVAVPNTTYLFGPFEKGITDDYLVYDYNDSETLFPSKGYRVATNTPTIEGNGEPLIFTGSIVSGPVFRAIENDATGNFHEWNLVGNPYPAYLDVAAFLNHVGSNSGMTNLSLLDESTAAIYGYNANSTGSIWTITNLVDGPALIAPGQGFFVSSKNPSATLEFTKDMQVVGIANDFILSRTSSNEFIKLKATTTTNHSILSVYFHDNGSSGLDIGYDAAVFGGSVSEFSLYSHLVEDDEGIPMVIQTLNSDAIHNEVIPLNLNANQGQQIAFSLDDYNLPSSADVYLEDRLNASFTLLTSASYTFTPNTTLSGIGRFFLHFTTSPLAIGENHFSTIAIYSPQRDRTIVIEGNLPSATKASVYDLLGRMVIQQQLDITVNKNIIDANTLLTGVYVVKLQDGNQQLTKKLIIR